MIFGKDSRFCIVFRLILSSFQQDGVAPTEVDVGRRQIAQALVVAAMVVVLDIRWWHRDRRTDSNFPAGCGSSAFGANARSCPGSVGGRMRHEHVECSSRPATR